MGANKGYENEVYIAEALNGKKFYELNINLQAMIRDLFGQPNEKETIECEIFDGPYKPDITIRYKGQTKYVSIKCGRANELHGENIKPFVLFLRSLGVSKRTQVTLVLYQFGDGTIDGTGKRRMNNLEVNNWLRKRLKEANDELNMNREVINKTLDRVMFQGILESSTPAEYIYFGTPEIGKVVSKKQIQAYVNSRGWRFFQCLHIGPIFLKPHARYTRSRIKDVQRREEVYCYWPNLADDLDRISKRFNF